MGANTLMFEQGALERAFIISKGLTVGEYSGRLKLGYDAAITRLIAAMIANGRPIVMLPQPPVDLPKPLSMTKGPRGKYEINAEDLRAFMLAKAPVGSQDGVSDPHEPCAVCPNAHGLDTAERKLVRMVILGELTRLEDAPDLLAPVKRLSRMAALQKIFAKLL